MSEPFFIAYTNTREHDSSKKLKVWTSDTANAARDKGAKYGRVSTNPVTGEVVLEAWTEENPTDAEMGEPRWKDK